MVRAAWLFTGCLASDASVPSSIMPQSGATLGMRLEAAHTWTELMEVLGHDKGFRDQHWGIKPLSARAPALAGSFSLSDVRSAVADGQLLAGQNAFLVRNPESFETVAGLRSGTVLTAEALEIGLSNGTMVLNDAAAAWAQLFDVVRAGVRGLGLPVGVNVYITHSSLERSTPLHTDRQDVMVMQCEGRKHWRVHGPLVRFPAEHQERGKSGNRISAMEAGPALIDMTLSPGDLLYIPRGFVHSTSAPQPTAEAEAATKASQGSFSTSLTIGIQTESMGFTYDKLLLCGLFLNGDGPSLEELRALTSTNEAMRRPLPLPGSLMDRTLGEEERGTAILERAVDELLGAWPAAVGSVPPPRTRLLKAAQIIARGHRLTLEEYERRMWDTQVPRKLRQEVWKRRYQSLLYQMLGHCGFLTRCFPRKFWLAKHTTQQRCWKPGASR